MTNRTLCAGLAACAALSAAPAVAGDVAMLNVIGFKADASMFVFEEYGVQDGSGFPYANRYYIDVATDKFVAGTPIRVRIEDEAAKVSDARAQAKQAGQAIASDAELEEHSGFLAGYNPVTELSADPHHMAVNPLPIVSVIDPPLEFRLEEIDFPAKGVCLSQADNSIGFRLLKVGPEGDQFVTVLHEDASIPSSRGCTGGYRLGGVQSLSQFDGPSAYAVLIAVASYGFEGPDYRWMAVTRMAGE